MDPANYTLDRIVQWGDDPGTETAVEAVERHHEAALAERYSDDNADGEGGS